MRIEEAIKTAIEFEKGIRDLYHQAADAVGNRVGENLMRSLAEDEQNHVDYLEDKMRQWHETGLLNVDELPTVNINSERIIKDVEAVAKRLSEKDHGLEQQLLSKALKAELATSKFYSEMVESMQNEGQRLFQRFLDIENEHINIVQAQMDYLTKSGYWFGIKEFDME